ncbi:MAG: O-antigen ligase family protein [Pirellulales bacterium]
MGQLRGSVTSAGRVPLAVRGAEQCDALLLGTVDAAMAGCILVVPFLMGGRQALGQLALVTLAAVAAAAWCLRQGLRVEATWRPTWAGMILLGGTLLLTLQLIPLPQSVLKWIAPHTLDLLPLWSEQGDPSARLGTWRQISLTPAATQAALVLFLSYSMLFLVTVQRVREVKDVERLLRWIAMAATLMAAFGLVQFFAGNGKFFWCYQHPFSDTLDVVKGSFTNRNHFASFLALGIGPVIWWIQSGRRQRPSGPQPAFGRSASGSFEMDLATGLRVLALGIVLFAGLLSLSRGGMSVLFLAAMISAVVCHRASALGWKFIASLAAAGVLIGASLTIFGYERVSRRLDDLSSGSVERLDQGMGRRTIWAAVMRAVPDFAVAGSGVGSHRDVYPMYLENPPSDNLEYTHAENSYLQLALETGATGLTLSLAGVGFCVGWCVRGLRKAASKRGLVCAGAVAGSLAACGVHAACDFVWYVPGLMAAVAILAGCACRLAHFAGKNAVRGTRRIAFSRPIGLAAAGALAMIGVWLVQSRIGPVLAEPYWDRYQIAAALPGAEPSNAAGDARNAQADANRTRLVMESNAIACLEKVTLLQPDHAKAHLELAGAYLRLFDAVQASAENAMSLPNLRDAAIESRFPTRKAQDDWLLRAVGKHCRYLELAQWHTRRALELAPLQGRGYLYLAELCFLDREDAAAKRAYVRQALAVRPFDGAVLYAAALDAWLEGNPQAWLDHARRAFASGPATRRQMIDDLVGRSSPEGLADMIAFVLTEFQPDLDGLRILYDTAARRGQPDQLAPLVRHFALAAETAAKDLKNDEAARVWMEARDLHARLADGPRALACARRALECDPSSYPARHGLAVCLLDQEQYDEAESQFRWCLQRRPSDQGLEDQFKRALKGRLDRQRAAATRGDYRR